MKTVIPLCLTILFIFSFSNKLFAVEISLEEIALELKKINSDELGLLIWDQRPMVIDQSREDSFIGYRRSITGIAYPVFSKSNIGISKLLLNKVRDAYAMIGAEINVLESSPFDKKNQILRKITDYEHDKVLLIKLNNLQFDGVFKIEYLVNLELQLYNSKGELLFDKNLVEKIPIGSKLKRTVPKAIKGVVQDLLNANDVVDAINKVYTNNDDIVIADKYDMIITKEGEEIVAIITEIDSKVIKYKPYDNLKGPIRVIDIAEVFMVKYKNGDKEVFKE